MDCRGPRQATRLGRSRRRPRPHRPDDLEVVEPAPAPLGAALEMLERRLHDPAVESDEEERPVGDLASDLDRLRPRSGHDHRDAAARAEAQSSGRAVEVDGLAREQPLDGSDARAHLGERRRLAADRARRRVAGADHELHPSRRQLLDGLDGAGEHGRVPGERIRDGGEQRQPRRVRGRLAERDEAVTGNHLAIEDPGALEARRLDVLDEAHELRHRGGPGHSHGDADTLAHRWLLGWHLKCPGRTTLAPSRRSRSHGASTPRTATSIRDETLREPVDPVPRAPA